MKVSVIIPVYNQAHFLKESVTSVLVNSYSNLEIIIVNDGSGDDSLKIAESLQAGDERILVIDQINIGLSGARNNGILNASGDILHFLDSDDLVSQDCYESVVKEIQDTDLLISSYTYLKEGKLIHRHFFENRFIDSATILRKNIAPPISFFLKKDAVKQIGFFDEFLVSCEDWDYWIRAARLGLKFKTYYKPLVFYRYVPNSMSRNPEIMYEALTEVSRRAVSVNPRRPPATQFNRLSDLCYPEIQKNHLITVLGVMLHRSKVDEALEWYLSEQQKWKWKVLPSDWERLSSYLSWGYFFEASEIKDLLTTTQPGILRFFLGLGYTNKEARNLARMVFATQLKKRNHLRFGKLLGGIWNKMGWY